MTDENLARTAVSEWLDEPEGFGVRRERLYDDLLSSREKVIPWLEEAFRQGMAAAKAVDGPPKDVPLDEWVDERRKYAAEARDFPYNTCPASRHLEMIADALVDQGSYPMISEDPRHVAGSIYGALGSLWGARSDLDADAVSGPETASGAKSTS